MDELSILDQDQPAVPLHWVESLFSRMQLYYGNRFLDMFCNANMDDVKLVWAQQMALLTEDELRRGVAALIAREWPPSLPEFVKLCKLSVDPEVAYFEAVEQGIAREEGKPNRWSSPAIYWAWRAIGGYEFRTQSYGYLKGRWSKILAAEVAKGEWLPIPDMALQLGVNMKSTDMSVRGVQELSKSIQQFQCKSADTATDHRRWAKEIVRKLKQGEPVALMASTMAQAALGLRK